MPYQMRQEVKTAWISALRSERYQQTTEYLHRSDDLGNHRYCAMGILCDIAPPGTTKKYTVRAVTGDYPIFHKYDDCDFSTPINILVWAGIPEYRPANLPISLDTVVTHYNDVLGASFAQIADWIETNVEGI